MNAKELKEELYRQFRLLNFSDKTCALAIYPNHWNIGDIAIWLGTLKLLKSLGLTVKYQCSQETYCPSRLAQKVTKGPIFLAGGGNFGDVYVNEVTLRQRIMEDFPQRQIIQCPQSIWFKDHENISHMQKLIAKQSNFTFFVRDLSSKGFANKMFNCPIHLCPDMAFALDRLPSANSSKQIDVLWLARRDSETIKFPLNVNSPFNHKIRDWVNEEEVSPQWSLSDKLLLKLTSPKVPYPCLKEIMTNLFFSRLAELKLKAGAELLNSAKVIITDRLHGHILALLAGKPNIILDNNNGKLKSFYQTWMNEHPLVHYARDHEEAIIIAANLLKLSSS